MNTEYSNPGQGKSFIPLTLLSISMILFFAFQLKAISFQNASLQEDKKKMEDNYKANVDKYNEAAERFRIVNTNLQNLASDLLETAKTDADARTIVGKFGIKQNPAPVAPPAEAPAH